jgi:hypothetical protein
MAKGQNGVHRERWFRDTLSCCCKTRAEIIGYQEELKLKDSDVSKFFVPLEAADSRGSSGHGQPGRQEGHTSE